MVPEQGPPHVDDVCFLLQGSRLDAHFTVRPTQASVGGGPSTQTFIAGGGGGPSLGFCKKCQTVT